MNPLLFIKGETLGKTIYNAMALVALVGVLGFVGFGLITGKYWKWKAGHEGDRADRAELNAATAQGNAKSADQGAANATLTRDTMGTGTLQIRVTTEQAAGRMENYDSIDADPSGALPADLVRELDAARARAGAAANRLPRKGTR